MEGNEIRNNIIDLLVNKAALKQDIADYSQEVLGSFKKAVKEELAALKAVVDDKRIRLKFVDKGVHEFMVYVGSDVLVFQLHRNIFRLPDDNPMWETDYLKGNSANGYFGIINIYNFLAESFEQNRGNDSGYLISRVFLNHNKHFTIEGEVPLNSMFGDLPNNTLSEDLILKISQHVIAFAIDFDLMTPPYEQIQEVSLVQIQEISSHLKFATGKRLGFRFSGDNSDFF